jgi:hypothetical protein
MLTRPQAAGALGVVGTVAALGLLLPSLDKVWGSSSSDPEASRVIGTTQAVYLGTAAGVTLLASYAQRSRAPFVLGFGLALVIVAVQEYTRRRRAH